MIRQSKTTVTTPESEIKVAFETVSKRKQVGILGGTFNPIHHAHLMLADQVYHQLGLDEVYLMPTNIPPHQENKETLHVNERLKMLELAVENYPHLKVETIELERQRKSYTYDTMKELKKRHPDVDYYFIIGGDMVDNLPQWYQIEKLLSLVKFVGVRRSEYDAITSYPVLWVDVPLMGISSSLIRERVANNCSVNFMLPEAVLRYIQTKGLYKDDQRI